MSFSSEAPRSAEAPVFEALPLRPDERLLFPGPDYLYQEVLRAVGRFSFFLNEYSRKQIQGMLELSTRSPYLVSQVEFYSRRLALEYASIYDALVLAVGKDSIRTFSSGDNSSQMSTVLRESGILSLFDNSMHSVMQRVRSERLLGENSNSYVYLFIRDSYVTLGGKTYLRPHTLHRPDNKYPVAQFCDGGGVLQADQVMIISESVKPRGFFASRKNGNSMIKDIPSIPEVRRNKQNGDFVPGHIDGHTSLVKGADGQIHLLVTRGYMTQDRRTSQQVQKVAKEHSLQLHVIDNVNLPPLPLNLVQFRNGTVVVSSGYDSHGKVSATSVTQTLDRLVGADKVIKTAIPVELLPTMSYGSIRCMTNVATLEFIDWLRS